MLVLDGLGPRRDRVRRLESQVGRRDGRATVAAMLAAGDVRLLDRLAQVVQVEADRRTGQLSGPVARRRVERDVDALKPVMLELLLQQGSQTLVEVRQRRVERYIDYQPHCTRRPTIYLEAQAAESDLTGLLHEPGSATVAMSSELGDNVRQRGWPQQTLYDEIPYDELPALAEPSGSARDGRVPARSRSAGASPVAGCSSSAAARARTCSASPTALPSARLVGIDLARDGDRTGTRDGAALGLSNVELRVGDVRDLAARRARRVRLRDRARALLLGRPADARGRCWRRAPRIWRPDGIAYVSFNTHPGGHFRRALRELALWYARDWRRPRRSGAARSRELFASCATLRGRLRRLGRAARAQSCPDLSIAPTDYLVHDLLGEDWEPVWFADFAARGADTACSTSARPAFIASPGRGSRRSRRSCGASRREIGSRISNLSTSCSGGGFATRCSAAPAVPSSDHFDHGRLRALRFRPSGPLGESRRAPDEILPTLAGTRAPAGHVRPTASGARRRSGAPRPTRCSTSPDAAT